MKMVALSFLVVILDGYFYNCCISEIELMNKVDRCDDPLLLHNMLDLYHTVNMPDLDHNVL